jgi:hypothetical protein
MNHAPTQAWADTQVCPYRLCLPLTSYHLPLTAPSALLNLGPGSKTARVTEKRRRHLLVYCPSSTSMTQYTTMCPAILYGRFGRAVFRVRPSAPETPLPLPPSASPVPVGRATLWERAANTPPSSSALRGGATDPFCALSAQKGWMPSPNPLFLCALCGLEAALRRV